MAELLPRGIAEATKPDKEALKALEFLTEEYPSVRNTNLYYIPQLVSTKSSGFNPEKLHTADLGTYLAGKAAGRISLRPGQKGWSSLLSPWLALGHESSHAFSGDPRHFFNWLNIGRLPTINEFRYGSPRAVSEGFAEGLSNAILGKYNKQAYAPYVIHPFTNTKPYVEGGWLGRAVGEVFREGSKVNQEEIINLLLDATRKHM